MALNHQTLRRIDKIVLWLNIVSALLLSSCYAAPFTDPQKFVWIAVLGFLYQFWVACNLLFVIYWGFRKSFFALISACSILSGIYFLGAYVGFRTPASASEKPSAAAIRVMQYNVHSFKALDKNDTLSTKKEVFDIIKSHRPDILTIVEFNQFRKKPDNIVTEVDSAMGTRYHFFYHAKRRKTEHEGNAIYSRYPIIDSGSIVTNRRLKILAIYADIRYGNKIIRVYSIHLNPVKIETEAKEQLLDGEIKVNQSAFILSQLSVAFKTRSNQVAIIKQHIKNCPYPYILTGDFNDTPISYSVHELGNGLKNAFREKGSGWQTTYYSIFPLQIDYIFASPVFDVLNYQAINKGASDHKPVISDLQLR